MVFLGLVLSKSAGVRCQHSTQSVNCYVKNLIDHHAFEPTLATLNLSRLTEINVINEVKEGRENVANRRPLTLFILKTHLTSVNKTARLEFWVLVEDFVKNRRLVTIAVVICAVVKVIILWRGQHVSNVTVNLYGVVKYNVNYVRRTGSSIDVNNVYPRYFCTV